MTIKSRDVLGFIFQLAREDGGLTIKQLSSESNVSVSTISRIEGGKIDPGMSNLFALAEGMSMPLEELLGAVSGLEKKVQATGKRSLPAALLFLFSQP